MHEIKPGIKSFGNVAQSRFFQSCLDVFQLAEEISLVLVGCPLEGTIGGDFILMEEKAAPAVPLRCYRVSLPWQGPNAPARVADPFRLLPASHHIPGAGKI